MKKNKVFLSTTVFALVTSLLLLTVAFGSRAQENVASTDSRSIESKTTLEQAMDDAWRISWSHFYHSRTRLFYDYITSYDARKSLLHLPTREEVARHYPNSYGYDTGMEDCMISAGVMLVMVVDRFSVTDDKKLSRHAEAIFHGIRRTATVHGSPGFIARGITIDDARSTYPSTSRDQVTHAVHGLWYYLNSPLSSRKIKGEIRELLSAIADRMKRNVTQANNYDFLRPDETCEPIGLQRMWQVGGHEAARLPMIYAAAWNATGSHEYHMLYKKYLAEAVRQSQISVAHVSTWGLLQMQCSMELLRSVEEDPAMQSAISVIMQDIARESRRRAERAWNDGHSLDLTMVAQDWRRPDGGIKSNGHYRKVWYCIRQSGESALAQTIAGPSEFPEQQIELLEGAIRRVDYSRVSSNGIFYLQAAYWKSRKMNMD